MGLIFLHDCLYSMSKKFAGREKMESEGGKKQDLNLKSNVVGATCGISVARKTNLGRTQNHST